MCYIISYINIVILAFYEKISNVYNYLVFFDIVPNAVKGRQLWQLPMIKEVNG